MIGIHAEYLHLLARGLHLGLCLFRISLCLLVFTFRYGVMFKKILRTREFFLFHLIVGERFVIIGNGASQIAAFERSKRLALFHVVPWTDLHLGFVRPQARKRARRWSDRLDMCG